MPGIDLGTLAPQLLDEMLQDHETEIAPLLTYEQFCDVRPVTKRQGSLYLWETPMGLPSNGHRSSKVAPGAPTPKGEATLGTVDYKAFDYKWEIPIEEGAESEISTLTDVSNKLVKVSNMKVLRDFNDDIAELLRGNDADWTINTLAAGNAWDTSNGDPVKDVDTVVLKLRGMGSLVCVIGYDVALEITKNLKITGAAAGSGREYVDMEQVTSFFRARGVAHVIVDGSVQQNAEARQAREYTGIYDGVCAFFPKGTLIAPEFIKRYQKIRRDDDLDVIAYKAKMAQDIVRAREAHVWTLSGIKS